MFQNATRLKSTHTHTNTQPWAITSTMPRIMCNVAKESLRRRHKLAQHQATTNKVAQTKFEHCTINQNLHMVSPSIFFNDTNKWPPITGNKPSAVTHMALHLPQMRSSGFTILISSEHKQLHASTVPMAQCMMGGTKAPSPQ